MASTEVASIQSGPLPIELITAIIAIVARGLYSKFDERKQSVLSTLAAASRALVSRTWNTICRSHILHTLVLNFRFEFERLCFLHFDAPHLCEYIRKVHLGREDFCSTVERFPEFLARLKNLRELVLENPASPGNGRMLPEPLSAGPFAAPRLRKIAFRH